MMSCSMINQLSNFALPDIKKQLKFTINIKMNDNMINKLQFYKQHVPVDIPYPHVVYHICLDQ